MLAFDSKVHINGESTLSNNLANSSGGEKWKGRVSIKDGSPGRANNGA